MLFADMSDDDQWPALLDSLTEKLRVNNVPHQVIVYLLLMQLISGVFISTYPSDDKYCNCSKFS